MRWSKRGQESRASGELHTMISRRVDHVWCSRDEMNGGRQGGKHRTRMECGDLSPRLNLGIAMLFFVLEWRQVAALHDNFTGKTAENLTFSDILCHFDRIRRVPSARVGGAPPASRL